MPTDIDGLSHKDMGDNAYQWKDVKHGRGHYLYFALNGQLPYDYGIICQQKQVAFSSTMNSLLVLDVDIHPSLGQILHH